MTPVLPDVASSGLSPSMMNRGEVLDLLMSSSGLVQLAMGVRDHVLPETLLQDLHAQILKDVGEPVTGADRELLSALESGDPEILAFEIGVAARSSSRRKLAVDLAMTFIASLGKGNPDAENSWQDLPTVSDGPLRSETPPSSRETSSRIADIPDDSPDGGMTPGTPSPDIAERPAPSRSQTVTATTWREPRLRTTLFPANGSGGSVLGLAAALPPPPDPATAKPDAFLAWFGGRPASRFRTGVASGLLEAAESGDLMEIEAGLHDDPADALARLRARPPCCDMAEEAAGERLVAIGRDLGRYTHTFEVAVARFAGALADGYRRIDPDGARLLGSRGAEIVMSEDAAEMIASVLDVEAAFLEDGPRTAGPPQDPATGAILPNRALDAPCVLDRAIHAHLGGSSPLGEALLHALAELRHAQVMVAEPRLADLSPMIFDEILREDIIRPMPELLDRLEAAIFTGPEPA